MLKALSQMNHRPLGLIIPARVLFMKWHLARLPMVITKFVSINEQLLALLCSSEVNKLGVGECECSWSLGVLDEINFSL